MLYFTVLHYASLHPTHFTGEQIHRTAAAGLMFESAAAGALTHQQYSGTGDKRGSYEGSGKDSLGKRRTEGEIVVFFVVNDHTAKVINWYTIVLLMPSLVFYQSLHYLLCRIFFSLHLPSPFIPTSTPILHT